METKIVFAFDEEGYFEGKLILDDTDKSPFGAWQIPARCVEIEAPVKKTGYKIKWTGKGWEYEEDAKNKEPEPLKPTFEDLKNQKLLDVNCWTGQKITGGFVSAASGQPVTYDSDKDTQLTMQGICLNVQTPLFVEKYPQGCPVRGYAQGSSNKTVFWLNADQVMQWQADLSLHIGACKQQGWQKQAEVEACLTTADLDKIVLE